MGRCCNCNNSLWGAQIFVSFVFFPTACLLFALSISLTHETSLRPCRLLTRFSRTKEKLRCGQSAAERLGFWLLKCLSPSGD